MNGAKDLGGSFGGSIPGKTYNNFLGKNLDKLLAKTGGIVLGSIKDPYMPAPLLSFIDRAHEEVWDDVEEEFKAILMDAFAVGDKEDRIYKEMRLMHWKNVPPALWPENRQIPNVYNWLRAKVLYAVMPADGTIFKILRDPFAVGVFLLKSTPTYGINVWVFVLIFLFMDKRDEFQLVRFILSFKGFHFLSGGLIAMTSASIKMFSCASELRTVGDMQELAHASEPEWKTDKCAHGAPGTTSDFAIQIAMEPVRILLIWTAFLLLRMGYARGGKEEIRALEQVRLDAADGSLDGNRDLKALRKEAHRAASDDIDDDEFIEAANRARDEMQAKPSTGGYLPIFLVWDVGACLTAITVMSYVMWSQHYTPEMWMFWASIFYMKAIYALLSFPFLVFMLPMMQAILTHAKPTGYDMAGLLCPKLSNAQIRRKFRLENRPLPSEENTSRGLLRRFDPFVRALPRREQVRVINSKLKSMTGGVGGMAGKTLKGVGACASAPYKVCSGANSAAAKIQSRIRGQQQRKSQLL